MSTFVGDIYRFFSSTIVLSTLLIVSLVSLLLSLSHPNILPPFILFGGVWYTKLLWLLFGFSLLMLFIKRILHFSKIAADKGFLAAASKALTSIPLAVTLIGLIILMGLIQTFVPQHSFNRVIDLQVRFNELNYAVMDQLRLFDIFDAWYLFVVVGLFVINLGACTVKRLAASMKYMKQKMSPKSVDAFDRMPESREFALTGMTHSTALEKIETMLKSKGFAVKESKGQLMAEKLRWERFSIDIFHIALIITITALVVSGLYGFNTFFVQHIGDTFKVPNRDYSVNVVDFDLDTYSDSERIMDWWTKLELVQNGEIVKECRIEVNKPCRHEGMGIYQAAMGEDWLGSTIITFDLLKKDFTDDAPPLFIGQFRMEMGATLEIPEENITIEYEAFLPDFAIHDNTAYSKSQTPENPGAFFVVNASDSDSPERNFRTWALQNAPQVQAILDQEYMFLLRGYETEQFTGLELSSDPGKGIAYASFSIIILTLIGHFLFNHQMLWVAFDPEKNKIVIGGRARKGDFEDRFGSLVDSIERELAQTIEIPERGVTT